jgi:hypothetical protein
MIVILFAVTVSAELGQPDNESALLTETIARGRCLADAAVAGLSKSAKAPAELRDEETRMTDADASGACDSLRRGK